LASAAKFAAAYAALTAAHEAGDYFVQRDADAVAKGHPGPEGAAACSRHCLTYTAAQAAALAAANRYFGLGLDRRRAAAGLALSALTHYVADRCAGHWATTGPTAPLLVRAVHATGKQTWLTRAPEAGALVDQAWHKVWVTLAAAVAAGPA
jgi:hypothetical protein